MFRYLVLILFLPASLFAEISFSLNQIADQLPSRGFEEKIEFWRSIFTDYSEKEALFHDQDDLGLIYEVMTFDKSTRNDTAEFRRQRTKLRERERQLQRILDDIRRWGPDSDRLTPEHRRIVQVLESNGYTLTSAELRELRGNIRYQRGIKEKFRESLVRSGKYLDAIEETLERHGVPVELAFLPHVESSFDYGAYSKRGAAGIWQFIRSTGRQYMTISSYVDERLDPLIATESAARLLRQNYEALQSWPLAVTAFNHGRAGMARAKRRHGDDLGVIIERYTSRTFGFASKNFYVEFLAAVEVAHNYTHYFGPLDISEPMQFDSVALGRSYHLRHITDVPELSEEVLREYNPQVRQPIWQGSKVLPRGLTLRLPQGKGEAVRAALESAPTAATHVFVADNGSLAYRVQYGDTLSDIAESLGTSLRSLQRSNGISNANHIYPGQLLMVDGVSPAANSTSAGSLAGASQYQVRRGDTLDQIAGRLGVSMRQLQQINDIDNPHRIYPGQLLRVGEYSTDSGSSARPDQYRVRRGDTLEEIAGRFGISVRQLQQANRISNPHRILLGQVLLIP